LTASGYFKTKTDHIQLFLKLKTDRTRLFLILKTDRTRLFLILKTENKNFKVEILCAVDLFQKWK